MQHRDRSIYKTAEFYVKEQTFFCTCRPFKLQSNRDTETKVSALQVYGSSLYQTLQLF